MEPKTPGSDMTPLEVVTQASLIPLVPIILVVLTTGWYLWSVRRLADQGAGLAGGPHRLVLLRRAAPGGGGCSPAWHAYDETIFTIHTVQHILIGMVAPIFLALSAPITLALQASNRRVQTTILKVLHSRLAKVLSHPLFTWPFYGVSLFALYFTSLYADSLRPRDGAPDLVHVHLILVVGCLFLWPVVGLDPLPRPAQPRRPHLLPAARPPVPHHPGHGAGEPDTPIAPGMSLTDLHTGGGLMWVAGEATGLLGTLAVFVQWLRADERAAKRNDRVGEAAAAVQLAHWRATRDAAARAAEELITLEDLHAARQRLMPVIRTTPVDRSDSLSRLAGRPILLKPEHQQRTGSFKIRGAYNHVAQLPPGVAVVAASAGNHAQGVALAAALTGRAATIFMPRGAALPKVAATRAYGAEVRLEGEVVDDCIALARAFAAEIGRRATCRPSTTPQVIAGQGTIGLELTEEAPDAEVVVVPVGGGGLISGVAAALTLSNAPLRVGPGGQLAGPRPHVRVIGVEAAGAPTLTRRLAAGRPVTLERVATMADGIAVAHLQRADPAPTPRRSSTRSCRSTRRRSARPCCCSSNGPRPSSNRPERLRWPPSWPAGSRATVRPWPSCRAATSIRCC